MRPNEIRVIALGVFLRGDDLLVSEGRDPATGRSFFRPPGGGIAFGEQGCSALEREIGEELGTPITDVRFLGAIENIFAYAGERGHGIVLLYAARFADPRIYQVDPLVGRDDDGEYLAVWKPLEGFCRAADGPLYPAQLLSLIDRQRALWHGDPESAG